MFPHLAAELFGRGITNVQPRVTSSVAIAMSASDASRPARSPFARVTGGVASSAVGVGLLASRTGTGLAGAAHSCVAISRSSAASLASGSDERKSRPDKGFDGFDAGEVRPDVSTAPCVVRIAVHGDQEREGLDGLAGVSDDDLKKRIRHRDSHLAERKVGEESRGHPPT